MNAAEVKPPVASMLRHALALALLLVARSAAASVPTAALERQLPPALEESALIDELVAAQERAPELEHAAAFAPRAELPPSVAIAWGAEKPHQGVVTFWAAVQQERTLAKWRAQQGMRGSEAEEGIGNTTLHLYYYAQANPLRYMDPDGHLPFESAQTELYRKQMLETLADMAVAGAQAIPGVLKSAKEEVAAVSRDVGAAMEGREFLGGDPESATMNMLVSLPTAHEMTDAALHGMTQYPAEAIRGFETGDARRTTRGLVGTAVELGVGEYAAAKGLGVLKNAARTGTAAARTLGEAGAEMVKEGKKLLTKDVPVLEPPKVRVQRYGPGAAHPNDPNFGGNWMEEIAEYGPQPPQSSLSGGRISPDRLDDALGEGPEAGAMRVQGQPPSPEVEAARKAGIRAHAERTYPPGYEKEVVLPSGRADAVSLDEKKVIELKPNNPKAIERGRKQVEKYCADCDAQHGERFEGEVQTYDPEDYM